MGSLLTVLSMVFLNYKSMAVQHKSNSMVTTLSKQRPKQINHTFTCVACVERGALPSHPFCMLKGSNNTTIMILPTYLQQLKETNYHCRQGKRLCSRIQRQGSILAITYTLVKYILSNIREYNSQTQVNHNCLDFKFAIELNIYFNQSLPINTLIWCKFSPIKAKDHEHVKVKQTISLLKQKGSAKVTHPRDPHH